MNLGTRLKWLFLAIWDEFKMLILFDRPKLDGQKKHNSTKHYRANDSHQKGNLGYVQSVDLPPIEIPQAPHHESQKEAETKARHAQIDFVLRLVAAVAAIIGIPVLVIQSCANLRQAGAGEKQLKEMTRENNLSERAWIYIEVGDNNIGADQIGPFIKATLRNAGKTPAMITGSVALSSLSTNPIPTPIKSPHAIAFVIDPNNSGFINLYIPAWSWIALTNKMPIYVFGTVFYQDIYGKEHWSECCYSLTDLGTKVNRMLYHNSDDALENAEPK